MLTWICDVKGENGNAFVKNGIFNISKMNDGYSLNYSEPGKAEHIGIFETYSLAQKRADEYILKPILVYSLSLRERAAIAAMQAIISKMDRGGNIHFNCEEIADDSVAYADELVNRLNKGHLK